MSKKVWIIFASVCVLLLASLVFISMSNRIDVSKVDVNAIQPASEQSGGIADHVFGNTDSPVILIEYGDFQCPGCGSVFPTVEKILTKYEKQLGFVFRNFPLTSIHPNAKVAAAAAEAAGKQGKFWEMYRQLYETQRNWEALGTNERTGFFVSLAEDLELDTAAFTTSLSDSAINQKINFDIAVGKKAGVDSTPTFFLNGERIDQTIWQDEAAFEAKIVAALEAAGIELPTETE